MGPLNMETCTLTGAAAGAGAGAGVAAAEVVHCVLDGIQDMLLPFRLGKAEINRPQLLGRNRLPGQLQPLGRHSRRMLISQPFRRQNQPLNTVAKSIIAYLRAVSN